MAVDSALRPLLEIQPGYSTDDNDDSDDEEVWMPGLPTLRAQQKELISQLREGFEGRLQILMWTHAVGVLSLGYMEDDWFGDVLSERYYVGAMLADQERRDALCGNPPDESSSAFIRDKIQQDDLAPAFQRAREEIRSSGGDFTDSNHTANPKRQRFIAMRPRLHQVAVAQHRAISEAFSEFASKRDVLDWADHLDYATLGYLPEEFPQKVASPTSDWWHVLTNDDRTVWLELRIAQTVLPAANKALRDAMKSGTEEPATKNDDRVPSG